MQFSRRVLLLICSLQCAVVAQAQPVTLFGTQAPARISTDSQAVELGVKFRVSQPGTVTGIRFYKGSGNTGTHVGNLWTSTGTKLASATFTGESATGWQRVTFAAPITISANVTYIASYHAPVGRYAQTTGGFDNRVVDATATLTALSNSESDGNGVYRYSATSAFPSSTHSSSNYWVDVDFVPGGAALPPPAGNPTETTTSVWDDNTRPAITSDPDSTPVELGVKFRSSVAGFISGVRFYKGPNNTGTHTATLWSRTGTQLAKATVVNESASGWQQVLFAAPVAITANTTYVVSYYAPQGRFSKNDNFFNSAVTNGPLTLLANSQEGGNGVFRYGSTGFPQTVSNSNYWVDVVFSSSSSTPPPPPPPPADTISLSVTPATVSLGQSQTRQFAASVSGTTNTAVSWTISPGVGSISSTGVYTAPSSITSGQNITVTATSAADTTKRATAVVSLAPPAADTTDPALSLTSPANGATVSGAVSLSATASDNVGVAGVRFQVDGNAVGSEDTSAPYSASWNTQNVSNGSYTIAAIARDAAGNTTTRTITVNVSNVSTSSTKLPIEVIGPDGTTKSVQFNLSSTSANRLSLRVHNLSYSGKASVQFNSSAWITLTDQTVTMLGLARNFGGFGGGFHTIDLTVNVPAGALVNGANTIRFRFNYDGEDSNGYRVLALNLLDSSGTRLLPAQLFQEDNPSTWTPPLTSSGDITEGRRLWYEASLRPNPASGSTMRARCSDCHAQDGRDLKYFNYSNASIRERAVFHGLSSQQGEQIASYIRSLNSSNPGRPWNPPYQPGPGMDSRMVTEWAAGAGLDAVLANDADTLDHIPSGSYPYTANLSARNVPVAIQLPDWNHWLPKVHPLDAWGDTFRNSQFALQYEELRSSLRLRDATAFRNARSTISFWDVRRIELMRQLGLTSPTWNETNRNRIYSASLWKLVKLWEVMTEFELEAFGKTIYGSQADDRAWWDHDAFLTSPNMLQIPFGPGMGNGTKEHRTYLSFIWYHLQLILNNSNKRQGDNAPIDWPYSYGFIQSMGEMSPQGGVLTLWFIKAMQISDNGEGPDVAGVSNGWQWRVNDISKIVNGGFENSWADIPSGTRVQVYENITRTWLNKVKTFTPQQFYTGGHASRTEAPRANYDGSFGQRLWYAIPRFRLFGVNQTMINEMADWAETVWPAADWNRLKSATCVGGPQHYTCSTD